jgi:hypothetical protein
MGEKSTLACGSTAVAQQVARFLVAVCTLMRWLEMAIDESYPRVLRPVVVLFGKFLLQHKGIKLLYPPPNFVSDAQHKSASLIQRQFRLWMVCSFFVLFALFDAGIV